MSTLKVDTITKADGTNSISQDAIITTSSLQLGRRNLIINGAMQVAQRGTSVSGITSLSTYNTVDRNYFYITNGTATVEQSSDAPEGFSKSFKATYTTGLGTFPSGSIHQYNQAIEAQNLTHLNYGTSAAKSVTVSFWMKSNVTGNRIVRLYRNSVSPARSIQAVVTQNVADTWEYKTVTFVGDVTGSMPFNANEGMRLTVWYGAGSNFTGGTLSTVWETYDSAGNAAGINNVGGTTNDYFAITGVQLEVGSVATPFEHRSYGEELALCKRYYQGLQGMHLIGNAGGTTVSGSMHFPEMRATPSFSQTGVLLITDPGVVDKAQSSTSVSIVAGRASVKAAQLSFGNFSGITQRYIYSDNISNATGQVVLDAEL